MIVDVILTCTGRDTHGAAEMEQLRIHSDSEMPALLEAFGAVAQAESAREDIHRRPIRVIMRRASRTRQFPSDRSLSVRFVSTKRGGFWQFGCPKCHGGQRDRGPRITNSELTLLLGRLVELPPGSPQAETLRDISKWGR